MCRRLDYQGYAKSNLCANFNSTTATMNVFDCPSSKACEGKEIGAAQAANTFTVYCLSYQSPYNYDLSVEQKGQATAVACGQKLNSYLDLVEGAHPKFCFDQSDCMYKGNITGTCVCGVDGLPYCQPSSSDSIWQSYYTAACLGDYNEMLYWQAYIAAVPYITNANSYHYKAIQELVDLTTARSKRTNFGVAGNVAGCPKIVCGFVDTDECSRFNGTYYNIYPNCNAGNTCLASTVMASILQGFSLIKCAPQSFDVPSGDTAESILFTYCAATPRSDQQLNEKLNGNNPKKCSSSADCGLVNGNDGQCSCSLAGSKYCELNAGDPELSKLYSSACDADMNATQFWYMYKSIYVLLQNYPSCSESVFADMKLYFTSLVAMSARVLSQVAAALLALL